MSSPKPKREEIKLNLIEMKSPEPVQEEMKLKFIPVSSPEPIRSPINENVKLKFVPTLSPGPASTKDATKIGSKPIFQLKRADIITGFLSPKQAVLSESFTG